MILAYEQVLQNDIPFSLKVQLVNLYLGFEPHFYEKYKR